MIYWGRVFVFYCLYSRSILYNSLDVKAKMEMKESPDKGLFIKDLSINIVKSV
jgi:hypothetical protein